MPRHAFSLAPEIRDEVRRYVKQRVLSLDAKRYRQEPAYVAALAGRLEGTAYEGKGLSIRFEATIVSDRGIHAAEKWSGVDLAITAQISDGNKKIRKGILFQAKRGRIQEMDGSDRKLLQLSVEKMKKLTNAPKVLELGDDLKRRPVVLSGNILQNGGSPKPYLLEDYMIRRVLTTLDGDTREAFVNGIQDSDLTTLKIIANTR